MHTKLVKFEIRNRWSGEVQFTAEITADETTALGVKIGLSVKWAVEHSADLRGANLGGADLRGANLSGADLRDANLGGANLGGANLRGANLRGANLSDADLRGANLSGANLSGANLGGADLRDADLGGANLSGADLRDADLRGANLRGANLSGANLRGADLRDADLSGADLRDADLRGANLRGANLSDADLRGANALRKAGVPHVENLHQKMLEAIESSKNPDGGLDMGNWHTCETTHCRAGWAITLAGDAGKALEFGMGSSAAGALIHLASCPWMEKVPDFHTTDEKAMADIQACAEREKEERRQRPRMPLVFSRHD